MNSSRSITDPDVQLLAAIAGGLESDYVIPAENDPWTGSPFAWIRSRPSRQKGKIGEQLVAGFSAAKELDVVASGDSQADRVIAGKRIGSKHRCYGKEASTYFSNLEIKTMNMRFASESHRMWRQHGLSQNL